VKLDSFDFEGPYTSADEIREEAGVYVVLSLRPERTTTVLDVGESGWNRLPLRRLDGTVWRSF